jgi:hypothetical protein
MIEQRLEIIATRAFYTEQPTAGDGTASMRDDRKPRAQDPSDVHTAPEQRRSAIGPDHRSVAHVPLQHRAFFSGRGGIPRKP